MVNVNDLLGEMAGKKKATKGSKKTTPMVDLSDDKEMVAAFKAWKDAKEREKQAEADRKLAEATMKPKVAEKRREAIQEVGAHTSAIKVKAGEVQLTNKTNKSYSKIATENEEALRETFGDSYDKYFETRTAIELTEEGAEDGDFLKKLITAVGPEEFRKRFVVEQVIGIKGSSQDLPPLVQDRDLDPKVAKIHDKAVEQGLIKPYSPSFTL